MWSSLPLADAFRALDLDPALAEACQRTGAGADLARAKWRHFMLTLHPDKRPADYDDLPDAEKAARSAKFHSVVRAYESIEAHLARLGAQRREPAPH